METATHKLLKLIRQRAAVEEVPEVQEQPVVDPYGAKRAASIAYLGENYILHPKYKFRERHAMDAARWAPHAVLRPIQLAAMAAGRI